LSLSIYLIRSITIIGIYLTNIYAAFLKSLPAN